MARKPNNRRKNAQKKPARQLNKKDIVQVPESRSASSLADDIDKFAGIGALIFGALAAMAQGNGFHELAWWLLCLTVCLGVTCAIAALNERDWLPWPIRGRPWLSCSAACILILVLGIWIRPQSPPRDLTAMQLEPDLTVMGMEPSIEKQAASRTGPHAGIIPAKATKVYLGNSVLSTLDFPYKVIAAGTEDILVVTRIDGVLLVSAKFFNRNGAIICDIVNNRFIRNQNETFRFGDSAENQVVVLDQQGKAAIDVEFINELAIRVLADIYVSGGQHLVISEDFIKLNDNLQMGGIIAPPQGPEMQVGIWVSPPPGHVGKANITLNARSGR
jgi:hypothetical protein